MSAITIEIHENRLAQLREVAERFGISAEDLVRVSIEELLSRPDEEFERATNFILNKNAELYRRLA